MRNALRRAAIGLVAVALLGACGAGGSDDGGTPIATVTTQVPVNAEIVHRDETTAAPRFAWLSVSQDVVGKNKGRPAREVAWATMKSIAAKYNFSKATLDASDVVAVHDSGFGPIVATFQQKLSGVEVFRSPMTIAFDREMNPVVSTGNLARIPDVQKAFVIDAPAAVAKAAVLDVSTVRERGPRGDSRFFDINGGQAPARAKKVWFDGKRGLEPAWYVELTFQDLTSFVISATTGETLFTNSMTKGDSYTYRVWADADGHPQDGPQGHGSTPHPTGHPDKYQAPIVDSSLLTIANYPFSQNDPWLAPGAVTTTGNNVDAFANIVSPDGFNAGDFRPALSGASAFDYTYDHTQNPSASMAASTTQLFFTLNFMHDFFYDAGYDETSGNAQADNYGRGGEGNDPITAQAQDVGGRNNANASTPADGAPPRIRMYVFDGNALRNIKVAGGAELATNVTAFGPTAFNLTGSVQLASPVDACVGPLANLAGKIALVDRGTCSAIVKVKNAQDAGAVGVVVANNVPGPAPGFATGPEVDPALITIPTLTLSQDDGNALKAQLPVDITLRRDAAIDRDGALDTGIVSHEWGHTLSNRLIGNANGLTGQQGGGMGEGWSDFVALLTLTRAENAAVPSNPNWAGTFVEGGYVESGGNNDGYYFGVRRVPYSVDFNKNALTFKHIEDGVALPAGVPTSFGLDGASNSEVHNTGEVWATMLWECYTSLLRDPRFTFQEANLRMRKYLVASLKLTPMMPTIVEARDALLAAAYATDKQDFHLFTTAFARRGAGVGAIAPNRNDKNNHGVKESFVTGADLAITSAKVEGTVSGCNPYGILRNGEAGTLTFVVRNAGTEPLLSTTVNLSSTDDHIKFPNGALVNVPAVAPFQSTTITVPVTLDGASFAQTIDTVIAATDPDLAQPRTISYTYSADYEYDVATDSAKAESFDTPVDVFSVIDNPATGGWHRVPDGTKTRWTVLDASDTADHSLVTPAFVVNAAMKVTFDHRYAFETAANGINYDGAVLEVSSDDGATWGDVGALASPGYTGLIDFDGSTNPLANRTAFTGTSTGYPAYVTTTLNVGAAYLGKTVKLRFRTGSDAGTGAAGWDLSKLSVTGISNKPFASRVPVVACGGAAPVVGNPNARVDDPNVVHLLHPGAARNRNRALFSTLFH